MGTIRISTDVNPKEQKRLEDLKQSLGLRTNSDVLRYALNQTYKKECNDEKNSD